MYNDMCLEQTSIMHPSELIFALSFECHSPPEEMVSSESFSSHVVDSLGYLRPHKLSLLMRTPIALVDVLSREKANFLYLIKTWVSVFPLDIFLFRT